MAKKILFIQFFFSIFFFWVNFMQITSHLHITQYKFLLNLYERKIKNNITFYKAINMTRNLLTAGMRNQLQWIPAGTKKSAPKNQDKIFLVEKIPPVPRWSRAKPHRGVPLEQYPNIFCSIFYNSLLALEALTVLLKAEVDDWKQPMTPKIERGN